MTSFGFGLSEIIYVPPINGNNTNGTSIERTGQL